MINASTADVPPVSSLGLCPRTFARVHSPIRSTPLRTCHAIAVCLSLLSAPAAFGEDWPGWRGPGRTDVSKESGLLKEWPEAGPPLVWLFKDAGIGYSGFAVVGDTLYTMGSREDVECLLALNVKDGTEKWSTKIGPRLENDWGDGPRDTPTVDGDFVYCLSAPEWSFAPIGPTEASFGRPR